MKNATVSGGACRGCYIRTTTIEHGQRTQGGWKVSKSFTFVSNAAKRAFLDLPKDIQSQFATDINAVQQGENPFSDFKHLTSIGPGVIELIENGSPAYRALYCAKHLDTVFILHAFVKTTNGVDQAAMQTAGARYKEMMSQVETAKKAAKKFAKKGKP